MIIISTTKTTIVIIIIIIITNKTIINPKFSSPQENSSSHGRWHAIGRRNKRKK